MQHSKRMTLEKNRHRIGFVKCRAQQCKQLELQDKAEEGKGVMLKQGQQQRRWWQKKKATAIRCPRTREKRKVYRKLSEK